MTNSFLVSSVKAREILDSRGNPTVEVELALQSGAIGTALVPSGASTGAHEAVELRDQDKNRFHGKGVQLATNYVNGEISEQIIGLDSRDQLALDRLLIDIDGSPNKSRLGANAILGVSLANAWAVANHERTPLYQYLNPQVDYIMPVPMCNVLNGGAHAENSTDFQEFMIVPTGAGSFTEGIRWVAEIYQILKTTLTERKLTTTVGDEGGFAPQLPSNEAAMELLMESIEKSGKKPGDDVCIALDPAATEFFIADSEEYLLSRENRRLTGTDLIDLWSKWCDTYPIVSIEDGLAEDDWNSWVNLTSRLGRNVQLVGDDLFVTDKNRLKTGIELGAANSILIKPNQIGTLSETLEAVQLAQENNFSTIISHRSGETEDVTISHLAVATKSGQIKTGAPARGERTAKYNELIRIEDRLGSAATYPGANSFRSSRK